MCFLHLSLQCWPRYLFLWINKSQLSLSTEKSTNSKRGKELFGFMLTTATTQAAAQPMYAMHKCTVFSPFLQVWLSLGHAVCGHHDGSVLNPGPSLVRGCHRFVPRPCGLTQGIHTNNKNCKS